MINTINYLLAKRIMGGDL